MLESGFESRLGLDFLAWYVAFSEARRQSFSPGTPVSAHPSSVGGWYHVAHDMLYVICTRLHLATFAHDYAWPHLHTITPCH